MMRPRSFIALPLLTGLVLSLLTGCASTSESYYEGETQIGLASWYGSEQQGHLTADGERFNMHLLTAAHRHLPFGTIVRVTNRLNGASVEVRINDRGPWGDDDRIIDLSSAAADVLQMKGAGLVPVEIQVVQLGGTSRAAAVE
jgi:rare lipoprotein A